MARIEEVLHLTSKQFNSYGIFAPALSTPASMDSRNFQLTRQRRPVLRNSYQVLGELIYIEDRQTIAKFTSWVADFNAVKNCETALTTRLLAVMNQWLRHFTEPNNVGTILAVVAGSSDGGEKRGRLCVDISAHVRDPKVVKINPELSTRVHLIAHVASAHTVFSRV